MAEAKVIQGKEHFEVDSALLGEIGEKLVTTPHVALAELVKNAYDADATEVHVNIGSDARGLPTVEIIDNGMGMTIEAIRKYWMRIGTTNKTVEQVSPYYGRPRTGAKGIGRFACRRLGTVLDLTSTALIPKKQWKSGQPKFERITLKFPWDRFKPGELVSKVEVDSKVEYQEHATPGLELRIGAAKADEWSFRGYSFLKRQLAVLCANQGALREGYHEDPGFKVFLRAPGLQEAGEVLDLREQLINAGWGTLVAHVDEDQHAVCTLTAMGVGKLRIRSTKRFTHLTDVSLRLGIFVMEREWMRDTSVISKGTVAELCGEWGGIQVRHKGFRVYPYGDEQDKDDWLGIQHDRARRLGKPTDNDVFDYASTLSGVDPSRSLLNMLSSKNYIGSVNIADAQKGLDPKADRMGFVENETFRELREFARYAIDWAMVVRDFAVQQEASEKRKELRTKLIEQHGQKLSNDDTTDEVIRVVRNAVARIRAVLPEKDLESVELLEDATALLESTIEINSRDLSRLRLLASASTLTLLFAHEIKGLTSSFDAVAKEIADVVKDLPANKRKRFEELGTEIAASTKSLHELLDLTSSLGVINQRSQPVHLDLLEAATRARSRFAKLAERYHIDIDLSGIPEGLQVGPMLEGELLAILLNTMSNSVKSVIAANGKHRVALKAGFANKKKYLDIYDTGIGLSKEHFEYVFTPLISDPAGSLYDELEAKLHPEDDMLLGSGTGLGLSIVRGILQARKGSARIEEPDGDWKFHLHIELP